MNENGENTMNNDYNMNNNKILILGGDGYLGWTLGLALANRTNKEIVLADNMIKRTWEKQVDAKLLVPLKGPQARVREFKRLYGKSNLSFKRIELLKQEDVVKLIKSVCPDVIINAAQQPSAPYSMMSPKGSSETFSNNILGHLNVLWSIAQVDRSITYIKLGSAGAYMDVDTSYLPLGKKDFTFTHAGKTHTVKNSYIPMNATDFYHQSKITDFLIDDLTANTWGLKIITVQQSTIFGATIAENHAPEHVGLSARFNYDAVFSTVINRFVIQSVINHPLTVYGEGTQRTGVISLEDTVTNFMKLIDLELNPGDHKVVHNYTHRMSIIELAEAVKFVKPDTIINHINNPRREPTKGQSKQVQLHPAIKDQAKNKEARMIQDLSRLIEFTDRHKDSIDPSIIMPKVTWDVRPPRRARDASVRVVRMIPGYIRAAAASATIF